VELLIYGFIDELTARLQWAIAFYLGHAWNVPTNPSLRIGGGRTVNRSMVS
jgi:hypothetical protein